MVAETITAMFLGLILINFNGANNFSTAYTNWLVVVEKVRIDAIIINKVNLHIVIIPLCNSLLENRKYIKKIKIKKNKNGLRLFMIFVIFILEIIIKKIIKLLIRANEE